MSRHAVVWDMGGTLLDTYPDVDRALYRAVHGRDPADEDALREVSLLTRRSIAEAIRALAARYGMDPAALDGAYADVRARWAHEPAPLMDGVPEVLAAVRRRGGLNLVVTHRDRASATDLLAGHGLAVDDLICADDGFPRKPDPAMITAVLSRHGVSPADALAIGDRALDVQAARAAGVPAVLLVTPGLPVADDAGASMTVTSVRGLLRAVADWGRRAERPGLIHSSRKVP